MFVVAGIGVGAALCARPGALWVALALACASFVVYWSVVVVVERGVETPPMSTGRGTHG
jgi:hypothetical protein